MRKINILFLLLIVSLFTSCFKDEGNYDYVNVDDIEIGGMGDTYKVITYAGNSLNIEPVITTAYKDLEYEWSIYSVEEENAYHLGELKAKVISNEKNLSYVVTEKNGPYHVVLKVQSKENDYAVYKTVTMEALTDFTRGFYVMKENADGDTDLDLHVDDVTSYSDLIKMRSGEAIPGVPRHLDVIFSQAFIDPVTEKADGSNTLSVTTKDNIIKYFRTSDLVKVMDQSNMFYEPLANDIPYRTVRGYYSIYYISSTGLFSIYGSDSMPSSGQFGASNLDMGGSTHMVITQNGFYMVCWSETGNCFLIDDFNGAVSQMQEDVYPASNLNYDCITCGHNIVGGNEINYFLMKDKTDSSKKTLIMLGAHPSKMSVITKMKDLDPASNFANGTCYATNGKSATLAYCITNNKLYAYDLAQFEERPSALALEGIPLGEQITYLSNQYWSYPKDEDAEFDYLMVGTQTGNTYKLYMYNMVGGEPAGKPVHTFTGTGKLAGVQYVSPKWSMDPLESYPRVDN